MVVFLYRWKIKRGKEGQFKLNWSIVTESAKAHCGSYGSRLHLADNGEWLAYAQWPSIKARESCVFSDDKSKMAQKLMRDAIEKAFPVLILDVKMDHLTQPAE